MPRRKKKPIPEEAQHKDHTYKAIREGLTTLTIRCIGCGKIEVVTPGSKEEKATYKEILKLIRKPILPFGPLYEDSHSRLR